MAVYNTGVRLNQISRDISGNFANVVVPTRRTYAYLDIDDTMGECQIRFVNAASVNWAKIGLADDDLYVKFAFGWQISAAGKEDEDNAWTMESPCGLVQPADASLRYEAGKQFAFSLGRGRCHYRRGTNGYVSYANHTAPNLATAGNANEWAVRLGVSTSTVNLAIIDVTDSSTSVAEFQVTTAISQTDLGDYPIRLCIGQPLYATYETSWCGEGLAIVGYDTEL